MTASTSRFRVALTSLFVLTPGLCVACSSGGSGSSSSAPVVFDGSWGGTWASSTTDSSGSLTLQLTQAGTAVTGAGAFGGHSCLGDCEVSCEVEGEQIAGSFQAGPIRMRVWGACSGQHHGMGPDSGSRHANEMTMSYEIQDGPCAGESGTMQLASAVEGTGVSEDDEVVVGEVILIGAREDELIRLPLVQTPREPAKAPR